MYLPILRAGIPTAFVVTDPRRVLKWNLYIHCGSRINTRIWNGRLVEVDQRNICGKHTLHAATATTLVLLDFTLSPAYALDQTSWKLSVIWINMKQRTFWVMEYFSWITIKRWAFISMMGYSVEVDFNPSKGVYRNEPPIERSCHQTRGCWGLPPTPAKYPTSQTPNYIVSGAIILGGLGWL